MTEPRSVLAEVLDSIGAAAIEEMAWSPTVRPEEYHGDPDDNVLVDEPYSMFSLSRAIDTGLSERGYTIVASDRLAGLQKSMEAWYRGVAARDQKATWQAGNAMHIAIARYLALSRSEATEKGAPRE